MRVEVHWIRARLYKEPEQMHSIIEDAVDCNPNAIFLYIDTETKRYAIPVKDIQDYNIDYSEEVAQKQKECSQCVH